MIRSLRRRFIFSAMAAFTILLLILVLGITLVSYLQMDARTEAFMHSILEKSGPPEVSGMPSGMPAGDMPEGFTPPEGASFPEGMSEMPAGGNMPEMPAGGGMPQGVPAAGSGSAKAALGDSPAAIIIYMDENTSSPNASFDCGLACQNMVIAANALGYGTKIISSPTMSLNGENHDALCEKLGVDPSLTAVAVLLVGVADAQVDGATGATTRSALEEKVSFVK